MKDLSLHDLEHVSGGYDGYILDTARLEVSADQSAAAQILECYKDILTHEDEPEARHGFGTWVAPRETVKPRNVHSLSLPSSACPEFELNAHPRTYNTAEASSDVKRRLNTSRNPVTLSWKSNYLPQR